MDEEKVYSLIDVIKFIKKTDQSVLFDIIDVWKLNIENMKNFKIIEDDYDYDFKNEFFNINIRHLQNHHKDFTIIRDSINKKYYDIDKCYYHNDESIYQQHGLKIKLECDYENSLKQMKLIRNKVNSFHWKYEELL